MQRLYACVISFAENSKLTAVAEQFAYRIERLTDGVLFEISGLENLIGTPKEIAKRIGKALTDHEIRGNTAVSENAATAILQARSKSGISVVSAKNLENIPLQNVEIEADTLDVFASLGIHNIRDLKQIPDNELIARYGLQFRDVLDLATNNGNHLLTPNLQKQCLDWSYQLDFPILNFEQLIFILSHGLEEVFRETDYLGYKTERIVISLKLESGLIKTYEAKITFPTLEIKFWLKVINLKIADDPPPEGILNIELTSHFAQPRSAQNNLFSATSLQPENLLLTVGKIKKLLGAENVGVPVRLDQRLDEPFMLDAEKLPLGIESKVENTIQPNIFLSYFRPPLKAKVSIDQKQLIYLKTAYFRGKVKEYSGVWMRSSQWWDLFWTSQEWDVELENGGIYRLKREKEGWFVVGEYD